MAISKGKRKFFHLLSSLVCGTIFGIGLAVSQMVNPQKVINFLDITGRWDPSLALVMFVAVSISYVTYNLTLKRKKPLFDSKFYLPTKKDVDREIFSGAAFFGIGWGMTGLCPGPAFAALGYGSVRVIVFLCAMYIGFFAATHLKFLHSK